LNQIFSDFGISGISQHPQCVYIDLLPQPALIADDSS